MSRLMRCPYCGLLQDEPIGVKSCGRCGGGLEYERELPGKPAYLQVQMELDQVAEKLNARFPDVVKSIDKGPNCTAIHQVPKRLGSI